MGCTTCTEPQCLYKGDLYLPFSPLSYCHTSLNALYKEVRSWVTETFVFRWKWWHRLQELTLALPTTRPRCRCHRRRNPYLPRSQTLMETVHSHPLVVRLYTSVAITYHLCCLGRLVTHTHMGHTYVTGIIQNFECVIRFVRLLYVAWSRWGTYCRFLCQEGQSSKLGLRCGVGKVSLTCNNPRVKCIGAYYLWVVWVTRRRGLRMPKSNPVGCSVRLHWMILHVKMRTLFRRNVQGDQKVSVHRMITI
jgi:hypothetical protein